MWGQSKKKDALTQIRRTVLPIVEGMERRVLLSTGSLSGSVFKDLSANGVIASGGPGIAGRTVYVDLNNNGVQDAGEPFTTTDSSGNYTLTNIPQGAAIVRLIEPSGERQTIPANGMGRHVIVGETPLPGVNFGSTSNVIIEGTVFTDTNDNGVLDAGEAGISGALVYVDLNHSDEYASTDPHLYTSPGGKFTFTSLPGGTYILRVVSVPANDTANPIVVTLPSGGVNRSANIAVQATPPPTATIDSAGDLDDTFGNNEGYINAPTIRFNSSADDITVLPNGQFLLYTGTLQRYNSDGTLDSTFGTNGTAATVGYITAAMVQASGDIVVTGVEYDSSVPYLERFLPNGKLDLSFGAQHSGIIIVDFAGESNPGFSSPAALLPLPSGQFVLGGSLQAGDGEFALERFNADGTVDDSFGGSGTGVVATDVYPSTIADFGFNSDLSALALTSSNEILATGSSSGAPAPPFVSVIARYTSQGILDTSFGQSGTGIVITSLGADMHPDAIRSLANGQFIVAGAFLNTFGAGQFGDAYALRYNADGSLDPTYSQSSVEQSTNDVSEVTSALINADGSVLFGGAGSVGETFGPILFRMTPAGLPDTTFNGGSAETFFDQNGPYDLFLSVALTADQRILALGSDFAEPGPQTNSFVARYLGGAAIPAGSTLGTDGTLSITGSGKSDVITVDLSGDGKSVIATVNGIAETYALASVKYIHIDSLAGDDSVAISSRIFINSTIYGGEGNDTLSGGSGDDLFYGNEGDDLIRGNAGNDRMYGGDGNDTLDGGLGNDYFYGEAGNDTADYSNRTENLQLHIGFGKNGAKGESDYISTDIETLIAGSGNDTLAANLLPAMLVAGSGNDTLTSAHGNATLIGGSGNDVFYSKNNHYDTIVGGSGNNTAFTDSFDTVTNVQHRST